MFPAREASWLAVVAATLVAMAPTAGAADGPRLEAARWSRRAAVPAGEEVRSLLPYVPTSHRYSCLSLDAAKDAHLDEIMAAACDRSPRRSSAALTALPTTSGTTSSVTQRR